jgi:hypothetical protein
MCVPSSISILPWANRTCAESSRRAEFGSAISTADPVGLEKLMKENETGTEYPSTYSTLRIIRGADCSPTHTVVELGGIRRFVGPRARGLALAVLESHLRHGGTPRYGGLSRSGRRRTYVKTFLLGVPVCRTTPIIGMARRLPLARSGW